MRTDNFKQDAGRGRGKLLCYDKPVAVLMFGEIIHKEKLGHALSLNAVVTQIAGIDPRGPRFLSLTTPATLV
jgi:hypothetical protein